jgi:hypothetical protein
MAISQ